MPVMEDQVGMDPPETQLRTEVEAETEPIVPATKAVPGAGLEETTVDGVVRAVKVEPAAKAVKAAMADGFMWTFRRTFLAPT